MAANDFDTISKEQFQFLELEYGFKIKKCKKEDWGYELIYLNITTGVKIVYEFREAYIFISLYKLVNGNFIENPKSIESDMEIHGYGLDDIINLRNSKALIKPAYQYGEESKFYNKDRGLMLFIKAFANNLKEYAADVLAGEFKIFQETKLIVRERANKNK